MHSDPDLVVGSVAAGAAILSFFYHRDKFARWQRTCGRVVDVQKVFDGEDTMRAPVVRFIPAGSDTEIEFESTRSSISLLSKGQQVAVLYDPHDPKSAIIAGWRQYVLTVFLGLVAIGALAGSLNH